MTIIQAQPLKTYGITGPASATDNEVPLFSGTSGKVIKDGSGLVISANLMQAENKALLLEGTTGATPASGAGTRMMWIPHKNAFRSGTVTGDQWDDTNIGVYSLAFGKNGTARGATSIHFGFEGIATGEFSTHFGRAGEVTGDYSTHFGRRGETAGAYSTHFGSDGQINGYCSTHFGKWGQANGDYSSQFGYGGWANSDYSCVGGCRMRLTETAEHSFAWGYSDSAVTLTQPNTFYIFPGGVAGKVAIGVTEPTAMLDIGSDTIRLRTSKTPASSGDAGNTGDECWDADYHYRCISTNNWKRSALSTW